MKDLEKKVKRSHVRQLSNKDCGGACLAAIVKFFGGEVSLEHLRRLSGTTSEGTTVLGLFQEAKVSDESFCHDRKQLYRYHSGDIQHQKFW